MNENPDIRKPGEPEQSGSPEKFGSAQPYKPPGSFQGKQPPNGHKLREKRPGKEPFFYGHALRRSRHIRENNSFKIS